MDLSLSQQNALRLALVFMLFEAVAALAVVFLLMLPMAERATSDLAGLMVLSAQTWNELPPDTRAAFEQELVRSHGLTLSQDPPAGAAPVSWGGPYLRKLAAQLANRTGGLADLSSTQDENGRWLWARLPGGGRTLWLGFPSSRIGTQPLATALLTMAAALALAALAAWWLGQRTVAPIRRFDAAAAVLGRGETPGLLPETGPRELAALARRFNRLARQVQELLNARTTLLAGLSHDLRTPLARMRLALEMLERHPDPAWIERLDADLEDMNRLIGDVLDLARGLGREAAVSVDVGQLLEDLANSAWEAGRDVLVTGSKLSIDAAPAALRRVLGNLLDNALRYTDAGPVELRAEAMPNGCRIGVLDRGPGIPMDQLESVFQPFYRVDASRNPATGGTGLGLAIVRQLAQANGWQISLENRLGGGLAAWVQITTRSDLHSQ